MVKNMFCRNCGYPLSDGAKFCPSCGDKIEFDHPAVPTQPQSEPNQPIFTTQNNDTQVGTYNDTAPVTSDSDSFFAQADFDSVTPVKKKRKKKAILISSISIVLVIAIVVSLVFVFKKDNDTLMSTTMDTLRVLNSNVSMSEKGRALANLYDSFLESSDEGSEVELRLNASDTVVSLVESSLSSYAGTDVDLSWIKDTTINYHYDMSEEIGAFGASVSVDGDDIIDVEAIIDTTTNTLFFGIPNWTDTYLYQTFDPEDMGYSAEEIMNTYQSILSGGGITEVLPTGDELEAIIDNYADIIDECFQNDKESDTTLTVNGVSQDVTMYTMDVTDVELLTAITQILEKAMEDQDIIDIIEKVTDFCVEQDILTQKEASNVTNDYVDSLSELYYDASDALEDATDETLFTLVRYVDSDDVIVGRELFAEGETVLYHATAVEDGMYASIFEIDTISIEGSGSISDGAKTGTHTIYERNEEVFEYRLTDFELGDYGPNGSITIYPPAEMMDSLDEGNMFSQLMSGIRTGFELDFASNEDSFGFDFNIVTGSEVLIGCGITISEYSAGDISVPENSMSVDDVDQWLSTIDATEIIEKLKETALNELIDAFESEIEDFFFDDMFSFGYDDYYDDFDF